MPVIVRIPNVWPTTPVVFKVLPAPDIVSVDVAFALNVAVDDVSQLPGTESDEVALSVRLFETFVPVVVSLSVIVPVIVRL